MPSLTLCSSAAFYKQVVDVADQLTSRGYTVFVPETAEKMRERGNFDVAAVKTWYANPEDYHEKTRLMEAHFAKVVEGDITLVLNYTKNGIDGYVGGAVLMEMLVAYQHKKPIYLLNPVSDACIIKEEVFGLRPVILDGDLSRLPGA